MPLLGLEIPSTSNLFERQVRRNLEEMFRTSGVLNPDEEAAEARERQLEEQGPTIGRSKNPFITWISRLGRDVSRSVDTGLSHIGTGIVGALSGSGSPVGFLPEPLARGLVETFVPQTTQDLLTDTVLATAPPVWKLDDIGEQLLKYVNRKASVLTGPPWTPAHVEEVVGDTLVGALEHINKMGDKLNLDNFTNVVDDIFNTSISKHIKKARQESSVTFGDIVDRPKLDKPESGDIFIKPKLERNEGVLEVVAEPAKLPTTGTYRSEGDRSLLVDLMRKVEDPWAKLTLKEMAKLPHDMPIRHSVPTVRGGRVAVETPGVREVSRRLGIPHTSVLRYIKKGEEELRRLGKGEPGTENIMSLLRSARSFINKRLTDEERAKIFDNLASELKGSVRGTVLSQARRYLSGERPSKIQNFNAPAVAEILNSYLHEVFKRKIRKSPVKD